MGLLAFIMGATLALIGFGIGIRIVILKVSSIQGFAEVCGYPRTPLAWVPLPYMHEMMFLRSMRCIGIKSLPKFILTWFPLLCLVPSAVFPYHPVAVGICVWAVTAVAKLMAIRALCRKTGHPYSIFRYAVSAVPYLGVCVAAFRLIHVAQEVRGA